MQTPSLRRQAIHQTVRQMTAPNNGQAQMSGRTRCRSGSPLAADAAAAAALDQSNWPSLITESNTRNRTRSAITTATRERWRTSERLDSGRGSNSHEFRPDPFRFGRPSECYRDLNLCIKTAIARRTGCASPPPVRVANTHTHTRRRSAGESRARPTNSIMQIICKWSQWRCAQGH